ncbi:hypothetical protein FACS189456_2800 [Bacteroidia bacterium]|nr:hypothetical protein FACS189456_2800 [Bacteroidia bacterium]
MRYESEFYKTLFCTTRQLARPNLTKQSEQDCASCNASIQFARIANLKKMKGHHSAYRIRVGNYRIGIFVEGDTIIFAILEHRKDIYRVFP